jgi:outer membrane protein assembly factor BamB
VSDWHQYNGDPQHSGVRRDFTDPDRVEESWTADLAGTVGSPVVDGESVFVGTDRGNLYAFDRKTGHRRWVFEAAAGAESTPTVESGHVHTASETGAVYALDPSTGEPVWKIDLPAALASDPAASDGRLYAGHETGLAAIDADTGDVDWTHETESAVVGCPAIGDDHQRMYAGLDGAEVHCLDCATGEEVWRVPTDGAVTAGPTIADGRVSVGDDAGTLLALDTETGQTWFSYEIRGSLCSSATVLPEEGTTFVGADDGYLHVTDTRFGRRKVRGWFFSKKGVALDGEIRSSPVVAGDVVCVGTSLGSLYGVDATTYDLRWHVDVDTPILQSPALAPDRLYVPAGDRLVCFEWAAADQRA